MSEQQPVSLSEAARQVGLNKSTISRQLAAGILRNRGTAERPLVDVAEVRAARESGLDRSKQRGPDSPLFGASSAIDPVPPESAAEDEEGLPEPPSAATKPASGGIDYQKARTAREGYQARLAQIELEQKLGNLLDKSEVVDAFFALGAAVRERLDGRRAELAARLVGIADPGAIIGLIAEADRALLGGITEEFERRFLPPREQAA